MAKKPQPKIKNKILFLPFISFCLLGLVFLNTHLYWLVLVALVPFLIFCQRAKEYSGKQIVRSVYWSGLVFCLAIFGWELQTTPNSWTALQGSMATYIKILAWVLSASFASVGFWLLGRFVAYFKSRPQQLLICLPAVWALCEFIRVFMFSVFSYGPGGSFSPNWNLGIAGLGLMPTPLSYLARFVGLYGMSTVVVIINIAVYYLFFKRQWQLAAVLIAPLLLLSLISFKIYQPSGKTIKVAAVHLESKDSLDSWDPVPLPPKDLDLLVIPEYSLFFQIKDYQDFANKKMGPQTVLVTSVSGKGRPATNDLTIYTPAQGVVSKQSKTFLISSGEYAPYLMIGFFKIINQDYLVKAFNDSQQVKRGASPEHAVQTPNLRIGSLVCSGVLALNEYRRLSSQDAEVLTNSASLSLIAQASLYHVQESYLTKFHAVANAKPFVQASRSGESYILNGEGNSLASASGDSRLINADVRASSKRTFYTLLGEWTLLADPLWVILGIRRLN